MHRLASRSACVAGYSFTLEVSVLEIYNDTVRDLLDGRAPRRVLDGPEGVCVEGRVREVVADAKALMATVNRGMAQRAVRATGTFPARGEFWI